MIINDYDANQKIEVLNELDKRIECVHFDFNDRIEKFLNAASLQHLRYVICFEKLPQTQRSKFSLSCTNIL